MQVITNEMIQQVLREQGEKDFWQTERLIARLSREQSAILAYLMGANEDQEQYNFDEKQLLFFLGVNISQMMQQTAAEIKPVSMADLEAAQEKNIRMFEYLEDETPNDFESTTALIFKQYNQKYVLRYVVDSLMDDDDPHIRPERKGLIFFNLKTILDCLDQ